jgi:hypothetical protein
VGHDREGLTRILQSPFNSSISSACRPPECRDLGLVLLQQVHCLYFSDECTNLKLADSYPDQLLRNAMLLRKGMWRLTCDELLSNLPPECCAVRPMLRYDFHPPGVRQGVVNSK